MAAENARRARLLSMGEMLRQYAVGVIPDQNAAYLLVHRALSAAFDRAATASPETTGATLRSDIDRLAATPLGEVAPHGRG